MPNRFRLPLVAGWKLSMEVGRKGSSIGVDKFNSVGDITVNGIALMIHYKLLPSHDPMFCELLIEVDIWVAYFQFNTVIRRFGNHA